MKKFLAFFTATVVLAAVVFGIYFKYIYQHDYMVFIESISHGVMTVDGGETKGSDDNFRVKCNRGQELTININPERTDSAYYNLDKLMVNGVDVTDDVSMLQYKITVDGKMNVVAFFEEGKRPDDEEKQASEYNIPKPDIEKAAVNEYLGSFGAYDISDPSVIYDEKSGYFYCFGSDNVVVRSNDLLNWTARTTYFPSPENASSNAILNFNEFNSVKKWAGEHGYDNDITYSDATQDRTPHAPDIIKIGKTYYLYFHLSKLAEANESAIFCVKTNDLYDAIANKNWTDVGLVICSCGRHEGSEMVSDGDGESSRVNYTAHYDGANAVHPSVINTDNGIFMVYGGYYGRNGIGGGIYLLELSKKTGLPLENSAYNAQGPVIASLHGDKTYNAGTLVAQPGKIPSLAKNDGSLISGAELVYNKKTDYYYLLTTYGVEDVNQEIRVARSASVAGPYVDYNGNEMTEFGKTAKNNQYTKGTQLVAGYGFEMSSYGCVSYTDVGRASLGSPDFIYTKNGTWFMLCHSQTYFDVDGELYTGYSKAVEKGKNIPAASSLDVREVRFTSDGWPMAMCEMYSGKKAETDVSTGELYGNWDVVVFDKNADSKDYTELQRSESQTVSVLKYATISQKNIAADDRIDPSRAIRKDSDRYILTLDGVEYAVYPAVVWDWELGEGSIVFTGIGADGSTIWAKKNSSATLGIYTGTFYHVLDMCDEATMKSYKKKVKKISSNPTQSYIDKMTANIVKKLAAAAE